MKISARWLLALALHVLPDFCFSLASKNGKPIAYETRLTLTLAPR